MKISLLGRLLWAAFTLLLVVYLIAPTIVTALYSVGASRYFRFPIHTYSLTWYGKFFASATFQSAMVNSAILAIVVTPICLLLALPVAHGLARAEFKGKNWMEAMILSPLVVPGVVSGVAFLSFFRLLHLDMGLVAMSIAMVIITFPFALRALAASYHSMDAAMEEAARDLGCGPVLAYWKVTLPQLHAGLLAAAIFVFAEVIDNFSVNVFLVDLTSNTLPIAAYQHIRDFDDPLVAVMSTLLSILSLVMMVALGKVVKLDKVMT